MLGALMRSQGRLYALDVSEASDRDGASATLDGAGLVDVAWADAASEADVGSASDAFLSQAIRGYSAARFDRRSVP